MMTAGSNDGVTENAVRSSAAWLDWIRSSVSAVVGAEGAETKRWIVLLEDDSGTISGLVVDAPSGIAASDEHIVSVEAVPAHVTHEFYYVRHCVTAYETAQDTRSPETPSAN